MLTLPNAATGPAKTIVAVLDWHEAVRQADLTALRDTIGQSELDHLLKNRLNANLDLKQLLSAAVQKWGVEIAAVELKDLDTPENMQRAIAKEAEAIREKRARIVKADGELEAATKLNEAAAIRANALILIQWRLTMERCKVNEIGTAASSEVDIHAFHIKLLIEKN
jgi:regulator of protease activity HflC (stomatin/prohibitin superfamily)